MPNRRGRREPVPFRPTPFASIFRYGVDPPRFTLDWSCSVLLDREPIVDELSALLSEATTPGGRRATVCAEAGAGKIPSLAALGTVRTRRGEAVAAARGRGLRSRD